MKTFAEILRQAAPRHVVVAPAAQNDNGRLLGKEHKVTCLDGTEAVAEACRMIRENEADILLQGDMPLADFFLALEKVGARRDTLSHVTVLENKRLNKLLFITDTYIHNFPTLE